MNFTPIVGWGELPEGWRYVEVAGVAVGKTDNVFCFTRGEHPVYIGELGADLPVSKQTPKLGPRVTVLNKKGERVCRFGGQFRGEKPGEFTAPHTVVTDSRGDVYVGEVSYTSRGQHETPPREIRSLQKFKRTE